MLSLVAEQTRAASSLRHSMSHLSGRERNPMQLVHLPQPQAINWIHIVGGQWLLLAMSDLEPPGNSVICLFSITSLLEAHPQSSPQPVAKAFLEGSVLRGLVDVSSEQGVVIAIELRTPSCTLEILAIRSDHYEPVFARMARYQGISHIRDLSGSLLALALHDDVSLPSVLDWATGSVTHLHSRPDPDGSAVAMALSRDRVGVVTPRKVHLMCRYTAEGRTTYESVAEWAITVSVGYASLTFGGNYSSAIRVCIANSNDGIEIFSIPESSIASSKIALRDYLIWSHQPGKENTQPVSHLITKPLFGRTCETVSWLESLLESSPSATMRFKTTVGQFSHVQPTSSADATCFTLSGPDIPALYALSVRDYDDGLGLLAIGNTIGEFMLCDFTGDALSKVRNALQSIVVPPLGGLEQLPKVAIPSYPPQLYFQLSSTPCDAERAACIQLWQEKSFELSQPSRGWSTTRSQIDEDLVSDFCDGIGNLSWTLAIAYHFLGKTIPLMKHICGVILLEAGGLYFLYDPTIEPDGGFKLLPPQLTLHEISTRLLDHGPDAFQEEAVYLPRDTSELDAFVNCGAYERRDLKANRDRWREFFERGGKIDPNLLTPGNDSMDGN